MVIDKFNRLEAGLTRLLESHENLKAENNGLRQELAVKEREIRELKETLRKLDGEKEAVREKVDMLLERIEGLLQGA